jgi:hypothetical protein
MNNKKKLQEGDVFYVQMNEKYIFARILVDVNERILKIEPEHKYKFYSGCYLVEVYKGVYDEPKLTTNEIIIPGQFTFKSYFYSKNYKIEYIFYEHRPINYRELDFPESLETGDDGLLNLRKFDVSVPSKTLFKDFPRKDMNESSIYNPYFTGGIFTGFYQLVDEAFHLQGRDDLLWDKERIYFSVRTTDLRLSPEYRRKFYQQIGENIDTPYYEMALKHGFDLARLY